MPIVQLIDNTEYVFKVKLDGDKFCPAGEDEADTIDFSMRRLTHDQVCELDDGLMEGKGDKTKYNLGTNRKKCLRLCIKGWKNMLAADGSEIPYSYDHLNRLPAALIKVLDKHIQDENGLGGEKEKN